VRLGGDHKVPRSGRRYSGTMTGEGAPPRRDSAARARRAHPGSGSSRTPDLRAAVREALGPLAGDSVLHLPLPPRPDDDEPHPPAPAAPAATPAAPVDVAPVLEAWMAPLVGEVARLRLEVAELRAQEGAGARSQRGELLKLLVGVMVCFALVATALVLVLKG